MNASLRTEYNDFLYFPIADDPNGMPLTLLSAIARRGDDPWEEAANLASLSRESAQEKLVSLIGTVPNGPAAGDATATLATRLVALLHRPAPRPARAAADSTPISIMNVALPKISKRVRLALLYLAALLFLFAAQWAVSVWQQSAPTESSAPPRTR